MIKGHRSGMEAVNIRTVREPLYNRLKVQLLEYIESENLQILPTEKELMARYGVSRNTLRRAVKELTAQKVLQPVQGLGTLVYPVPEVTKNSRILVLCDYYSQPFQNETFNKLLFMLNSSHLNSVVMMVDHENIDIARFEEALKDCDGVIVDWFSSYISELLEIVVRSGKKIICLRSPMGNGVPYLTEDIAAGYYKITRHLLELGHTRIAFIGNSNDPARMDGMRKALKERGLSLLPELMVYYDSNFRFTGFEGTEILLERKVPFTAVIAHNDDTALGIQERLLIAGKRIPEDISVIGSDNLSCSEFYPVPLTTCSGDAEAMIRAAIAYLFSARNSGMTLNRFFTPELVIRKSTARLKA